MTPTDKMNRIINNCPYRNNVGGTFICALNVMPCIRAIDTNQCTELKEKEYGQEVNKDE